MDIKVASMSSCPLPDPMELKKGEKSDMAKCGSFTNGGSSRDAKACHPPLCSPMTCLGYAVTLVPTYAWRNINSLVFAQRTHMKGNAVLVITLQHGGQAKHKLCNMVDIYH
jgi:hypothetical protein